MFVADARIVKPTEKEAFAKNRFLFHFFYSFHPDHVSVFGCSSGRLWLKFQVLLN